MTYADAYRYYAERYNARKSALGRALARQDAARAVALGRLIEREPAHAR